MQQKMGLCGLAGRWLPGRCPCMRRALPDGGIGGLELVRGGTDLERPGVNPGVAAPRPSRGGRVAVVTWHSFHFLWHPTTVGSQIN